MNSLHEHLGPGLKGNNPLHFLASLGTFRLLYLHDSEARMKWDLENNPFPIYQTTLDEKNFCGLLAEDFGWNENKFKALKKSSKAEKPKKNPQNKGKNFEATQANRFFTLYPVIKGKKTYRGLHLRRFQRALHKISCFSRYDKDISPTA